MLKLKLRSISPDRSSSGDFRLLLDPGGKQRHVDGDTVLCSFIRSRCCEPETCRPDADHALARLNSSPRHGEWVMISLSPTDSLRAWVMYPERKTKAPVVVVVHEIFGLSPWIRGVADQLAADGFIAIAPDFLTMKKIPGWPDSISTQDAWLSDKNSRSRRSATPD